MDLDDLLADIGDRFRAERQARNWSQMEFAEIAGLNITTVKGIESGRARTMTVYFVAAQALHRSFTYMMSTEWRMPDPVPSLAPYQIRVLESILKVGVDKTLGEAGALLGLNRNATASVMSRIYQKLKVPYQMGVDRKAEAVKIALEHGLIKDTSNDQTHG